MNLLFFLSTNLSIVSKTEMSRVSWKCLGVHIHDSRGNILFINKLNIVKIKKRIGVEAMLAHTL